MPAEFIRSVIRPESRSQRSQEPIPDKMLSLNETEAILLALGQAVEQRDRQTAGHCERLSFISVSLGVAMGLDRDSLIALYRGGYERWDGTGYPDGLEGDQTPLLARVLQIADIYDALISPRPYKEAMPAKNALRTIEEETSKGWRDPEIVELFLKMHKDVVSRVACFNDSADRSLESLRVALSALQEYLG
jgi:HD-GYP domain-containing protein (c-di-GMP phosphodiesterase class II)